MSKFKSISILPALLLALVATANAQKLPRIQQASIWAPAAIKIDGKATEWNDKFQADNEPDRVFYTIANDDKNLYLIVRTRGLDGNEKIMRGGLTITIQSVENKSNKGNAVKDVAITYPLISNKKGLESAVSASKAYRRYRDDTIKNAKKIDSLQLLVNTIAGNAFKEIKVEGVKEITAPVISVYNENGIKSAAVFTRKMEYTYELAIPLRYVAISSDGKLRYNIKLGETQELDPFGGVVNHNIPKPMINGVAPAPNPDNEYMYSAVDFWGEYTLAKK